ncbi:MAG: hypothetical protein JO197_07205 [Acidobacteria bacterium]|nr:hypothetical protein [Acidobacteriota bacterium]MBV9475819.1 hypothetical protein [Acidobacteriota bacterium]
MAYTAQQRTAVLSILSNLASNRKGSVGDLRESLEQQLTEALQSSTFTQYIGRWDVVWGPQITKGSIFSDEADNAMYVARSAETNDHVVAIAGTNPGSLFDAAIEDLAVGTVVGFGGLAGAEISKGTQTGIIALQNMTDPRTTQTLRNFLDELPPTNANLIFTGHSLGGALSPAIALDLVVSQGLDTSKFKNVYVYPSAGPTPGNDAFMQLFTKTFPAVGDNPFNAWNQNVRNTLDAIPRAWAQLAELPALYPPLLGGRPVPCVQTLVNDLLTPALKGNTYTDLPFVTFEGTFDGDVDVPAPGVSCAWLRQMVYQHIEGYYATLIPELQSSLPVLLTLSEGVCLAFDGWCAIHRL